MSGGDDRRWRLSGQWTTVEEWQVQDWVNFLPVLMTAVVVLLLPGWALVVAVGARGSVALGLAGPVGYSVIGGAATVGPWLGLDWGWQTVLPVLVACLVAAVVVGRLIARWGADVADSDLRREPWSGGVVAVGLGAAISVFLHARMVDDPDNFADRFDNVFHLNAARYALETGQGSPLEIGGVTAGDGAPAFYPAVWHDLVALVAQVSNASIVEAANAVNMAVVGGVWVAGAVLLGHVLAGPRGTLVAAVVAGAFPAFPHLLFEWGTLYPNATGLAAVPALLALALVISRRLAGIACPSGPTLTLAIVLVVMAVPGIALAHPSTLLVVGLALACAVVGCAPRALGADVPRRVVTRYRAVLVTTVLGLPLLWAVVRPSLAAAEWRAFLTTGQAIGEALTSSVMSRPLPFGVTFLVLLGAVVAFRRREWPLLLFWAATMFLYVVAAGSTHTEWRNALTGGFYRDNYRVAAVTVMGALPLAVLGGVRVVEVATDRFVGASRWRRPGPVTAVTVAVMVALVLGSSYQGSLRTALDRGHHFYTDGDLLTEDERELIATIPGIVPDDALLLGIPRSGAAYAYALTGIEVGEAHMFYTPTGPVLELEQHLADVEDPRYREEVCAALAQLDRPVYVLDFAPPRGTRKSFPGFLSLREPIAVEVAAVGRARLLEVEACGV